MRLLFWLDFPSLHQAPLLREIAAQPDVEVFAFMARDVPEWRRRQGWERPDFGDVQVEIEPDEDRRRQFLCGDQDRNIHVFFGIHAYPFVYSGFQRAVATGATVGIWSEPQFLVGWKGPLRLLRSRQNARRYGDRIDFILAAGQLGVDWYRRSGFDAGKLFPFGYFVDGSAEEAALLDREGGDEDNAFHLLFVGELAAHKGLDLLLKALAGQSARDWRLDIVGDGPLATRYKKMARRLGVGEKIRWLAVLPNDDVQVLMGRADLVVLPSRFDGWGAVVNESLMAGTPVVCSDACGAADLLKVPQFGTVFRVGSVASLQKALKVHLEKGPLTAEDREQVLTRRHRIKPATAARYVLDIVRFVRGESSAGRPAAPWRKNIVDG